MDSSIILPNLYVHGIRQAGLAPCLNPVFVSLPQSCISHREWSREAIGVGICDFRGRDFMVWCPWDGIMVASLRSEGDDEYMGTERRGSEREVVSWCLGIKHVE